MISVVMPAYNAQRFVAEAVESILAQTYRDFEFVIVDDGSTDETLPILRRYAAQDARIRLVEGDHRDLAGALNLGVAHATRPWVARMDADDMARPDRFARQLAAAAANPRVLVWGSYALHVNAAGKVLGVSRTGPTTEREFDDLRRRGADVYVHHPTWLARRDVILKLGGYDPRFDSCEDFELLDRIADLGPVLAIPEPLLRYRVHSSSSTARRFFAMRHKADYVVARRHARMRGEALSWEAFEEQCRRRPLPAKAAAALHTASMYYYRKAGLSFGDGRVIRAGACLAAATAMNPAYAVRRAWRQVLSGTARRMRAGAESASDDVAGGARPTAAQA